MSAARVNVTEVDLSARVPNFEGAYGGIVLPLKRGPVDKAFLATTQTDFLSQATPNNKIEVGHHLGHFSALAFLEKSNKLWVRRAVPDDIEYGELYLQTDGTFRVPLAGSTSPEGTFEGTDVALIRGSDPGAWNQDIKIKVFTDHALAAADLDANPVDQVDGGITAANDFVAGVEVAVSGSVPDGLLQTRTYYVSSNSSASEVMLAATYADALAGDNDLVPAAGSGSMTIRAVRSINEPTPAKAFGIEVYYQDVLVETFICSRIEGQLDGFGRSMFIETVLERSKYIRGENAPINSTTAPVANLTATALSPAVDGTAVTDSNMVAAASIFRDKEAYPLTLLMDSGWSTVGFHTELVSVCESRRDAIAILTHDSNSDTASEVVEFREVTSNINSSFAAMFSPHIEITDRYNNRNVNVPPDGYVAGAFAESSNDNEPWFPVAGQQRGVLNVNDVAVRYNDGDLDYLYDSGVNPIRFRAGSGITIWGNKTLQRRPSSLDRINVRMLLLAIAPQLQRTLEDNFLFELNDEVSRQRVRVLLNAYMESVQSRRGVTDFRVVVDETNNPPADIDNGILNVEVFMKPTRAIEEINLALVLTSSSIDFNLPITV